MDVYEFCNIFQKGIMPRGGKRKGAGRKKSAEPTVPIRVPLSQKQKIQKWLKQEQDGSDSEEIISILENALKLRANAGGKIKVEIRKALKLLS